MDPAALKQFTTLNRELRAARAKQKEAEDRVAAFAKLERAQTLAKEGKHYDAAREAGIDVDAALAELLGAKGAPENAELRAITAKLEALEKAREAEAKTRDEAEKRAAAAEDERGRAAVVAHVGREAAKYPHLAKAPELVHAALKDADAAYAKLKTDGADLTADEKNALILDALAAHEEKWAKTFGAPAKPVAGFGAELRGNVTEAATGQRKAMTFAEVKAARQAARKK